MLPRTDCPTRLAHPAAQPGCPIHSPNTTCTDRHCSSFYCAIVADSQPGYPTQFPQGHHLLTNTVYCNSVAAPPGCPTQSPQEHHLQLAGIEEPDEPIQVGLEVLGVAEQEEALLQVWREISTPRGDD